MKRLSTRALAGAAALSTAVSLLAGCGDDNGVMGNAGGNGTAGAASGASSGGAASTAGASTAGSATVSGAGSGGASGMSTTGGSSGTGDLSALCMSVCTTYDQACPGDTLHDCAKLCEPIVTGPSACEGLQRDYLTCLSKRKPNCGANDWATGYETTCDAGGRGLCLLTKGAECIAGAAYDNTLCQAFTEGNFGYYCQLNVTPKPGCKFSQNSTREGLYCCETMLTLP